MALQEDTIGQTKFITTNDMAPEDHICNFVVERGCPTITPSAIYFIKF